MSEYMGRHKKTQTGFAFFLSAIGGAFFIFFNREIDPTYGVYLPTLVIAVYAAVVAGALKKLRDEEQAEHQIDSVYFLGFLFTLISLFSLFAGFSRVSMAIPTDISGLSGHTESIFRYLGISVSTSIAGVLLRSILRGYYLGRRATGKARVDGESVDNTEQLLGAIADSLAPMREYLSERNEKRQLLSLQEDAYLASLDRFIKATESFSSRLDDSRQLLGRQVESFSDTLAESEAGMRRMNEISRALTNSAGEMERFSIGTEELNVVLDGLLEILEKKVEKVV
jgi:hypothetical protein